MEPFIRVSALVGYCELVTDLGGDAAALLDRYHIAPATLEREENLIPLRGFLKLLEYTAAILACPSFGMQLARRQGILLMGPVGLIGLNSPTLGDALLTMQKYLGFHCPASISETDTTSDPMLPRITFDLALDSGSAGRQIFETGIANIVHEIAVLTQGKVLPQAILFRHSAPGGEKYYRDYFRSQVHFEQEVNAVVLHRKDLDFKLDKANAQLQKLVIEYVRMAGETFPADIVGQIRFLIKRLMPAGECSLEKVAANLSMNPRTLQRRLKQHNLVFGEMVDKVRRERAKELLSNSHLSVAHVAAELGYAEQAVFNRACQRWFEATPLALRRSANF